MSQTYDITAILTAHAEGPMVGASLRSLDDAVRVACRAGIEVEILVTLDSPTPITAEIVREAADRVGARVVEVDHRDQGQVRNDAVDLAAGRYLAFLDGDDLWSENWLADAYQLCESDPGRVIAHPAANWFFENDGHLWLLADQTDPGFELPFLRVFNYWDALCLAPATAYAEHRFSQRAIKDGYAFEDWHWNMETVVGGYLHRVVPETIHFKRRRTSSQTIEATANKSLTRPSEFLTYTWAAGSP